jgi:uncharacterized membrane protein YgdD (TMEM256/DUF423 family)
MLMNKYSTTTTDSGIQLALTRATRTIYFFIALFMLSIVIFDSGNLITRESIIDRWTLVTMLLFVNTFVWFGASQKWPLATRKLPILLLSASLLIFAGFMTYWERGMASTSTILYALPILVIAITRNRHAVQAISILAAGIYAFSAVKYFNDYFNEGYRVQLWGTIVLVGGCILTVSWLTMIITGLRKDSK